MPQNSTEYLNRRIYYSINVQLVVGPDLKIFSIFASICMLYLPDSRKVSIPPEIPSTLLMPTKESSFSSVAVRGRCFVLTSPCFSCLSFGSVF
jgi:hypothetical protein